MIATFAAAILALSAPLYAQEFAAEMDAARALVLRAQAGRPWLLSHKNGLLQQSRTLAHLTSESKPFMAMIVTGQGTEPGFIGDRGKTAQPSQASCPTVDRTHRPRPAGEDRRASARRARRLLPSPPLGQRRVLVDRSLAARAGRH